MFDTGHILAVSNHGLQEQSFIQGCTDLIFHEHNFDAYSVGVHDVSCLRDITRLFSKNDFDRCLPATNFTWLLTVPAYFGNCATMTVC